MCTEFDQDDPDRFARLVGARPLPTVADLPRKASHFPGHVAVVIGLTSDGKQRVMAPMRWGLIPGYYTDPKQKPQPYNARAETIDRLPLFRESFRARRCLVPTAAFFDWHRGTKKRYRFVHDDGRPLMYAGVWDVWDGDGQSVWSFCIITCPAN